MVSIAFAIACLAGPGDVPGPAPLAAPEVEELAARDAAGSAPLEDVAVGGCGPYWPVILGFALGIVAIGVGIGLLIA